MHQQIHPLMPRNSPVHFLLYWCVHLCNIMKYCINCCLCKNGNFTCRPCKSISYVGIFFQHLPKLLRLLSSHTNANDSKQKLEVWPGCGYTLLHPLISWPSATCCCCSSQHYLQSVDFLLFMYTLGTIYDPQFF